jgi:hypothetical protein
MAIAFRATGAWADTNGGTLGLTIPAGAVSGDLMIAFVGGKPFNSTVTINQSWNNGGGATDGTTGAGGDTGSMQARIFWKIHTGTETNPTVSMTNTNVFSGVIVVFSKAALQSWDLVFGGGGDNTAGTGFSATTPSLDLATNDWVASFITTRSDAGTIGTFTTTATGITFGGFNSQPTAGFTTTTGGDMSARSGYNTITAGTATTAVTVAATLGAAHTGSMFLVRMREITPVASESFDPMGMMGFFGI